MTLQHIFIYPVKSLGGIELREARVLKRGLQYDRRYMLVDGEDRFLTQREHPSMALIRLSMDDRNFYADANGSRISFPLETESGERMDVRVWNDTCEVIHVSQEHDSFFSSAIGMDCKLVYMPDTTLRQVDMRYAGAGDITSFTDGYPVLLIGSTSLDDLNGRLDHKIGWDRFRPSLVVKTQHPYEEDDWKTIQIGDGIFEGVKKCSRCVMTTIDQQTATASKEPLKTLSKYRTQDNHVYFGQNLVVKKEDSNIRVGDQVRVPVETTPV